MVNCENLLSSMGFDCSALSDKNLRVWSPFTYGDDGEVVGFYVEKTSSGYRVTDGSESLQHAASMGIRLSRKRLDLIRQIAGKGTYITEGGEIVSSVDEANLSDAIASVLNTSMAVSHFERQWLPRHVNSQFTAEVGERLQDRFGDRLKRNIAVNGASGHQIEIPFVVQAETVDAYIQPVAYGNQRVNWDLVYRGFGKMTDLKNVGAEENQRIIVIDDRSAKDDISQAITFLSTSASIVRFNKIDGWMDRLAA